MKLRKVEQGQGEGKVFYPLVISQILRATKVGAGQSQEEETQPRIYFR